MPSPLASPQGLLVLSLMVSSVPLAACGGSPPPRPETPNVAAAPGRASEPAPGTGSSLPQGAEPPPYVIGSKRVTLRRGAAYRDCVQSFSPAPNDPVNEVVALAKACAAATNTHPLGDPIRGEQGDAAPPQRFSFKADANRCYRVYAAAQPSIKDFNVALKDSSGEIAASVSSQTGRAAVGDDAVVCFKEAEEAQVVLSVGMGKGKYAVQIWGTREP